MLGVGALALNRLRTGAIAGVIWGGLSDGFLEFRVDRAQSLVYVHVYPVDDSAPRERSGVVYEEPVIAYTQCVIRLVEEHQIVSLIEGYDVGFIADSPV